MGMVLSKESILKKGNESLAMATVFSIGSLSCPCPTCIGMSLLCFANSVREKLGLRLFGCVGGNSAEGKTCGKNAGDRRDCIGHDQCRK
jgi:hypothetical protein